MLEKILKFIKTSFILDGFHWKFEETLKALTRIFGKLFEFIFKIYFIGSTEVQHIMELLKCFLLKASSKAPMKILLESFKNLFQRSFECRMKASLKALFRSSLESFVRASFGFVESSVSPLASPWPALAALGRSLARPWLFWKLSWKFLKICLESSFKILLKAWKLSWKLFEKLSWKLF